MSCSHGPPLSCLSHACAHGSAWSHRGHETKPELCCALPSPSCRWRLLATPASRDIHHQRPGARLQPGDEAGDHPCQDEAGRARGFRAAACRGLAQQAPAPLHGGRPRPSRPAGTVRSSRPAQAARGSRRVPGQGEALVVVLLQLSRPAQTSVAAQAALRSMAALGLARSGALPLHSRRPRCTRPYLNVSFENIILIQARLLLLFSLHTQLSIFKWVFKY